MKQNFAQLITNKNGIIIIEELLLTNSKVLKEFEKDLGESTRLYNSLSFSNLVISKKDNK